MKKTVAAFLVFILVLSLTGCFKVNIDLPLLSGTPATDTLPTEELPVTDLPTTGMPELTTDPPTTLPAVTEPVSTTEYHDDYDLPAYTTEAPTTTEAPSKTPPEMSPEEVVNYFNDTLNAVKSQKVGFKKSKLTSVLDLQLSNPAANSLVSIVKSALLSDTADEATVKKGDSGIGVMSPSGESYVSKLTPEDVASVKVTNSGENYVITLTLNDLTNPDKTSAYGKVFDFMTADDVVNIYAPKVGATVAKENVEIVFSGCYAELTVDKNDHVVSYTTYVKGVMNMKSATIRKVITINTDLAITLGSTTEYTNFVY